MIHDTYLTGQFDDAGLDSRLAIFTRSTRGQEMPSAEQIPGWPGSLRTSQVLAATVAVAIGGVVLSWLITS